SAAQLPLRGQRERGQAPARAPARIRVIACPSGGAFAGKSDPFRHEIVAAKLAMLTGRPVKITLAREGDLHRTAGEHRELRRDDLMPEGIALPGERPPARARDHADARRRARRRLAALALPAERQLCSA